MIPTLQHIQYQQYWLLVICNTFSETHPATAALTAGYLWYLLCSTFNTSSTDCWLCVLPTLQYIQYQQYWLLVICSTLSAAPSIPAVLSASYVSYFLYSTSNISSTDCWLCVIPSPQHFKYQRLLASYTFLVWVIEAKQKLRPWTRPGGCYICGRSGVLFSAESNQDLNYLFIFDWFIHWFIHSLSRNFQRLTHLMAFPPS